MRTITPERTIENLRRAIQDLEHAHEHERDLHSLVGTVSPRLGHITAAAHAIEAER